MPSSKIILYMLIAVGVLLGFIVVAYMVLRKKLQQSDVMQMQKLRAGTQEKNFFTRNTISEIIYKIHKNPLLKKNIYLK